MVQDLAHRALNKYIYDNSALEDLLLDFKNPGTSIYTTVFYISKITRFLWHLVPAGASLYKTKKAGREKKSKPGLLRCKHMLDSSHRVTHKLTSLHKTLPDSRSNACCGHEQSRCKLDTNNYRGRFSSIFYCSSQIDVPKLLN